MDCNSFRPPKFGGVRCRAQSDYEAKVVTPEQMIAVLKQLGSRETKLEWTLALVHGATALRPEECFALKWRDMDSANNQILVQRAWSKGKQTDGKTKGSMKPVAMHPALAEYLNEWREESCYNKDEDWVFASSREKGRVPRAASTCGKHYLRPAAVAAGVISKDDRSRFGWHNLRHSLATFFGSNEVHPSVIQAMLRHAKQQTTARYIHSVIASKWTLRACIWKRSRWERGQIRRPRRARVGVRVENRDWKPIFSRNCLKRNGGDDGTRTRGLCRDRAAF